jgi:hypothetical protein
MPVTDYIEATETILNRMCYWLFKPASAVEGAATQAHSGAVTAIKANGFASAPAATGYLILQNSAGETESIAYTAQSKSGDVYTFTVSATLKYSHANNDLVAYSASVYTTWSVRKFSGTSYDALFDVIPELPTPSVIVLYSGSDYRTSDVRRVLRLSVIIVAENYGSAESGKLTARQYLDGVIAAIDEKTYNETILWISGDNAVDLGNPGIAAYQVDFIAEDH